MYFKTIKISSFGSKTPPVVFSFDNFRPVDPYMMAYFYRKAVDTVSTRKIQRLDGFSRLKEQFGKEFTHPVQSSIETAFAEHGRHQSSGADKTKLFFDIAAKISGGKHSNSDDFRITCFTALRLAIVHRFQQIVKKHIYCNGFINYGRSLFLVFWYHKIKGLSFLL
jgi:hypothetical protein